MKAPECPSESTVDADDDSKTDDDYQPSTEQTLTDSFASVTINSDDSDDDVTSDKPDNTCINVVNQSIV